MVKIFFSKYLFFSDFGHLQGETGWGRGAGGESKLDQKCKLWASSVSEKIGFFRDS